MKINTLPVEATLSVIGGKWKVIILYHLRKGPQRTCDLKNLIPAVTQKMLTQQLRELERDGLVHREVFNRVPPHVEYSLTEVGWSLNDMLDCMCRWGEGYLKRVSQD